MKSTRRNTWSNKEAKFIELWQQRQHLYDISSKGYHDRSKREKAWRDISEELQIPIKEVMIRAASLRTQYGKLMHLKPSSSGHKELTSRKKWILKNLDFLKNHVMPRPAFSTLEGVEGVANDDLEWEVKIEDQTSSASSTREPRESSTPSPSPRTSPQRPLSKRLRGHSKLSDGEDTDSLEREKVTLLKQAVKHAFAPEDSADIFGKFVACKMREITSPVERIRAEHSITAVLYSALSHCSQLENNVIKAPEHIYPISPTTQTLHPTEPQQPYQLLVQIQPSTT